MIARCLPTRFLVASLFLACTSSCGGNPDQPKHKPAREDKDGKELRELVLREPSPEDQSEGLLGSTRYSHREMLDRIGEIATEPSAKGLFLQVGPFTGAWARSAELREKLLAVRKAGKPVHCYFEETDNVGYALLASVCDRISMTPTGMLSLVGVHAQVVYARDFLELLGIRADLMQVGKFKGAADGLTRSDMPPEVQETLGALMDDLQSEVADAVTKNRKLDAAALAAALEAGPQSPLTALRLHLVDAIAFDDEARAHAKQAAGADTVVIVPDHSDTEPKGLFDMLKTLSGGGGDEHPHGKRIALAYLSGTIGNDEEDSGSGVNAGPFIKAMHRFADDADVLAVVLRISSPGGSALASDRMWHAVRRVAKRKPVIVSVGDMAASGGYYVACAGTEILAESTSLVGSIGVVGGKIVVEDLAKRLGVHVVELERGKNSGWMSVAHPFSDSERVAIRGAMEETYDTFLARVSEGRHLSQAALAPMVEGRIMSGRRAKEGGLVDQLGGLATALDHARTKAGLGADATVELWPKHRSMLQRIASTFSGSDARALAANALKQAVAMPEGPGLVIALLSGQSGTFAALPYSLTIR